MRYRGRWIDRLLPAHCLLCGADARAPLDLCAGCTAAMPLLGPGCARCALPLAGGAADLCGPCLLHTPRFTACTAALAYEYPARELILRFKQQGELAAGRVLAALLAERLLQSPSAARADLALVPMPLHPSRLATRGFNQAERIARVLGHALDLPLANGLATRRQQTRDQKQLNAAQRRANLRDAFAAAPCPGRRLVIVDDVMTTGATADALAGVLLDAGATEVHVWCVARAL